MLWTFTSAVAWADDAPSETALAHYAYIAGVPAPIPGAEGDYNSRVRRMRNTLPRACGNASQQADAAAAWALTCPTLFQPLGQELAHATCEGELREMALRHLVDVSSTPKENPGCAAPQLAAQSIVHLAESWSMNQWPSPGDHRGYDTLEDPLDVRMYLGFAWDRGAREAPVLRDVLDAALALQVAQMALSRVTLTRQMADLERASPTESSPEKTDPADTSWLGTRARACDRFRKALVGASTLQTPEPVLALLVFAASDEVGAGIDTVPICHLPGPEFPAARLLRFHAELGTTAFRELPPPARWSAARGAGDRFRRAVASGDSAITLSWLRSTADLADAYLRAHEEWDDEHEVPLTGRMLNDAVSAIHAHRGEDNFDAVEASLAPRIIAALYVLERDEGGLLAAGVAKPDGRDTAWHPMSRSPALLQHGEELLDWFCTEYRPSDEDMVTIAASKLSGFNDMLSQDSAARRCAGTTAAPAAAESSTRRQAARPAILRTSSTGLALLYFSEYADEVRALIPGTGAATPARRSTRDQRGRRVAAACLWTERPDAAVVEMLTLDRLATLYKTMLVEASLSGRLESAYISELATTTRQCTQNWAKDRGLDDVGVLLQSGAGRRCVRRSASEVSAADAFGGRRTVFIRRAWARGLSRLDDGLPQPEATAIAEDVLRRSTTGAFPLSDCSPWEVEQDGAVAIALRLPAGTWDFGDQKPVVVSASPTLVPGNGAPVPPAPPSPIHLAAVGWARSNRDEPAPTASDTETTATPVAYNACTNAAPASKKAIAVRRSPTACVQVQWEGAPESPAVQIEAFGADRHWHIIATYPEVTIGTTNPVWVAIPLERSAFVAADAAVPCVGRLRARLSPDVPSASGAQTLPLGTYRASIPGCPALPEDSSEAP